MMLLLLMCNPTSFSMYMKDIVGWCMMCIVLLNIVVNLARNMIGSCFQYVHERRVEKKKQRLVAKLIKIWENREEHVFKGEINHFKSKKEVSEAYDQLYEWEIHRKWL